MIIKAQFEAEKKIDTETVYKITKSRWFTSVTNEVERGMGLTHLMNTSAGSFTRLSPSHSPAYSYVHTRTHW